MDIYANHIKTSHFEESYNKYFNKLEKIGKTYNTKPIPSLFHPIILSNETLYLLKKNSEQMASILDKTIDLYLRDSEVQKCFNFTQELHDWICIDPGYNIKIPISRYDGLFDGTTCKFCEFNTDGTSGMDKINTLDNAFIETNTGKEVINKYNLTNFDLRQSTLNILLKCYNDFDKKKKPNIAIVDFLELGMVAEFKALKNYFISKGYPTEVCDIRKLQLKKDGLWYNNFKIDLIYRRAVTDEIVRYKDDIKDFLKAYTSHVTCTVGPIRSQIVHSKLIYTFLSSNKSKKYFTDKEYSFIKTHIPETNIITNDPTLINKLLNNKDDYFVKPHNAYGCKGVYCGMDYSSKSWNLIINKILSEDNNKYLMQKKINIPKGDFVINSEGKKKEFNITLQPYIFNNILEGFYPRVSVDKVISTSTNASLLPIFHM
jgi:hypothetical protein